MIATEKLLESAITVGAVGTITRTFGVPKLKSPHKRKAKKKKGLLI